MTTGEPAGKSITRWDGPANQQKQYWLSLQLSNVRIDDIVEVDALLWDRHINRHRYPVASFDQGWLSMPVNLWAPPASDPDKRYVFLVFINGVQVRSFSVEVGNDPAPATATPQPQASPTPQP